MNTNDIIIRLERKDEQREVENLVREAFWNVYRPGCLEHVVLNQLRDDKAFVPELNFVMELRVTVIIRTRQKCSIKAIFVAFAVAIASQLPCSNLFY